MTNRFALAAAVAATIMATGAAQAQVHLPGGPVSSRIQAAVPAGLTSEADIQANLASQLGSAGAADITAYQAECGIQKPNGALGGPKTKTCLTLQAQAIAQARAGAPPPNAAPPTQAQVDALIAANCGGDGTQEFRGSDVILRCNDGRVFVLQPDQATCVSSGTQLVCEWTATLDLGGGGAPPAPASAFCDTGLGIVVCYALPIVAGSVALTAVTLWVGAETGAISGVIVHEEGGAP